MSPVVPSLRVGDRAWLASASGGGRSAGDDVAAPGTFSASTASTSSRGPHGERRRGDGEDQPGRSGDEELPRDGRPVVHPRPPPLEQVRPGAGSLDLVLDHVGERGLDEFARMIRFLGRPSPGTTTGSRAARRRPRAAGASSATSTWLSTSRSPWGTRARAVAERPHRVEDLQRPAAATRRPRAERTRRARRSDECAADFRPAVPAGPAAGRAEPRPVTAPSPGRSCPTWTPHGARETTTILGHLAPSG